MFVSIVFCFSFFSYIYDQIIHHIYNPEYVLIFDVGITKIMIKNSIYSSKSKNIINLFDERIVYSPDKDSVCSKRGTTEIL